MKNYITIILLLQITAFSIAQEHAMIMDHVVFYDGYAPVSSEPTPEGIVRLKNDINTTKLSPELLENIGEKLTVTVTISARCDNYDRIGNVFLAFVPKNQTSYNTDSIFKIELGRFITPFMNKNKDPKSVNYQFNLDHLAPLFQDQKFREKYDYWMELAVFGVPYAAQKEVEGCSDRNDTFEGKLELNYSTPERIAITNFIHLSTAYLLNNYEEKATDELGKTQKTFLFSLKKPIKNMVLYVISSNHGANEGGEEYIRRNHMVYLDDSLLFQYTPGGKSCEPFRIHNTQGNGIYGRNPETDSSWASWNNWCPGDVIPIRSVELGNLSAGKHQITISIPDAQFVEKSGYFPISMYLISVQYGKKHRRKN